MSHEEMEQAVDQEVLSIGFSRNFQVFLMEERLFEIEEKKAAAKDWSAFLRAFGVTFVSCGIFWAVVIWRFLA